MAEVKVSLIILFIASAVLVASVGLSIYLYHKLREESKRCESLKSSADLNYKPRTKHTETLVASVELDAWEACSHSSRDMSFVLGPLKDIMMNEVFKYMVIREAQSCDGTKVTYTGTLNVVVDSNRSNRCSLLVPSPNLATGDGPARKSFKGVCRTSEDNWRIINSENNCRY